MKTFDRQTFSGLTDSMENLSFPTKVIQAGKVALDRAKVAAEQFRAKKFELQKQVLTQWAEHAFLAEKKRIMGENISLLEVLRKSAEAHVQAGSPQSELLKSDVLYQTALNELKSTDAELRRSQAMLNGILLREPQAALFPPKTLPAWRSIPETDDIFLRAAVEKNPELGALAKEVQGRRDALELARMQWIPDINPSFVATGALSQAIGLAVVLPTTISEIRGGIKEAQTLLRESEAMLHQSKSNQAANFIATLIALRNSERETSFLKAVVSPAAKSLLENSRQEYAAGTISYLDYIDSYRTFLDLQLTIARAHTNREKFLAELEALAGVDSETLCQENDHD
jgi:outer membrane protein TolC